MKKYLAAVAFACAAMVMLVPAALAAAPQQLMVNGSFETGDFTGWGTHDLTVPFYGLGVRGAGFGNYGFMRAPTDGSYVADNGFDGGGPGTIAIWQDVSIPAGSQATLTFDSRAAWSMSGLSRKLDFVVEPGGGGTPVETTNLVTTPNIWNVWDTNAQSSTFDLSVYAGSTIRVKVLATIPQNFTGPAHMQVDNFSLLARLTPGAARGGYCSVAGNSNEFSGAAITPGTFLNLEAGQADGDSHYAGATPAIFVRGTGITCDPPPPGYVRSGFVGRPHRPGGRALPALDPRRLTGATRQPEHEPGRPARPRRPKARTHSEQPRHPWGCSAQRARRGVGGRRSSEERAWSARPYALEDEGGVLGGLRPRIPFGGIWHPVRTRAVSSAGRAPALHAGGRRFEPCTAHLTKALPGSRLGSLGACGSSFSRLGRCAGSRRLSTSPR